MTHKPMIPVDLVEKTLKQSLKNWEKNKERYENTDYQVQPIIELIKPSFGVRFETDGHFKSNQRGAFNLNKSKSRKDK